MKPYKTQAHIHSLNGKMEEITVLEKVGDNDYIVDYKGVKCHALFNWFNCTRRRRLHNHQGGLTLWLN